MTTSTTLHRPTRRGWRHFPFLPADCLDPIQASAIVIHSILIRCGGQGYYGATQHPNRLAARTKARQSGHPMTMPIEPAAGMPSSGAISGWRRFREDRAGFVSLTVLCALGAVVLAAPLVSPHSPTHQYYGEELLGPRPGFWFGTDDFGRDILSRCLYGAQLSLTTGLLAAAVAGVFGTALGMIAGYLRGPVDGVLGRIFDTILSFPGLLFGIAVAVLLGKGVLNAALAAAIINVPLIARLARAGVLSEQEKEYTLAARAIAASPARIIVRHLLPNIFPIILVQVTLTMADAMIIEAGLSFLGLGAQPPQASLGTMLRDSRPFLSDAVWYAIFPGLFLTVFLMLISFISDALAEMYNPRRVLRSAG